MTTTQQILKDSQPLVFFITLSVLPLTYFPGEARPVPMELLRFFFSEWSTTLRHISESSSTERKSSMSLSLSSQAPPLCV